MKLIGNYSEDIRELIQGGEGRQYSIPGDIFVPEGSLETLPSSPPDGYNPATGNVLIGTLSPQEQWIWNGGAWLNNGTVPLVFNSEYTIKLSVFQNGLFQEDYTS